MKEIYRSSRSYFFKIGDFKNCAIFSGKHLYWSFFLIKLQAYRTLTVGASESRAVKPPRSHLYN